MIVTIDKLAFFHIKHKITIIIVKMYILKVELFLDGVLNRSHRIFI